MLAGAWCGTLVGLVLLAVDCVGAVVGGAGGAAGSGSRIQSSARSPVAPIEGRVMKHLQDRGRGGGTMGVMMVCTSECRTLARKPVASGEGCAMKHPQERQGWGLDGWGDGVCNRLQNAEVPCGTN